MKHCCEAPSSRLGKKKNLEVLLGKSGAYKSKYALKPLQGQNMVHLTWKTNSVPMD